MNPDAETLTRAKSCLVLLGASAFPEDTRLNAPSVEASAAALKRYLIETKLLNLEERDVLDLFGSSKNPSDQLKAIRLHLDLFCKSADGYRKNVFILYLGHGLIDRGSFSLALATTEADDETNTSLSISALASVVKARAAWCRRFVILDCCFAGEALREFLGSDVFSRSAESVFSSEEPTIKTTDPKRGTTVLCAVDKDTAALAPAEMPMTLFTTALINVLQDGHPDAPPVMTFANVLEIVRTKLPRDRRPVFLSPDQTEGDIAHLLRIFPNPAAPDSPRSRNPSGPDVSYLKGSTPRSYARQQWILLSTAIVIGGTAVVAMNGIFRHSSSDTNTPSVSAVSRPTISNSPSGGTAALPASTLRPVVSGSSTTQSKAPSNLVGAENTPAARAAQRRKDLILSDQEARYYDVELEKEQDRLWGQRPVEDAKSGQK